MSSDIIPQGNWAWQSQCFSCMPAKLLPITLARQCDYDNQLSPRSLVLGCVLSAASMIFVSCMLYATGLLLPTIWSHNDNKELPSWPSPLPLPWRQSPGMTFLRVISSVLSMLDKMLSGTWKVVQSHGSQKGSSVTNHLLGDTSGAFCSQEAAQPSSFKWTS